MKAGFFVSGIEAPARSTQKSRGPQGNGFIQEL
jgi:hypothetical protein